jgi:hypothetical protein
MLLQEETHEQRHRETAYLGDNIVKICKFSENIQDREVD